MTTTEQRYYVQAWCAETGRRLFRYEYESESDVLRVYERCAAMPMYGRVECGALDVDGGELPMLERRS